VARHYASNPGYEQTAGYTLSSMTSYYLKERNSLTYLSRSAILALTCMAKILADQEIKKALGTLILGADESRLNPNGVELRLGSEVRFLSTNEVKRLSPDHFLKVAPGESVIVCSLEKLDFTPEVVHRLYPQMAVMGLITPTTTMMREGVMQVATKVDAGFRGQLNWGFRNSSHKDILLAHGEPIFKLTLFLLQGDEAPEKAYGERAGDLYQDTEGIRTSARRIPADIPKERVLASSREKLDPKRELQQAGYPFDHISTELAQLDGKFVVVSSDVGLLKEEIGKRTDELTRKTDALGQKTDSLAQRVEQLEGKFEAKLKEFGAQLLEKVESLFTRKFTAIVGTLVGAILVLLGAVLALQKSLTGLVVFLICLAASAVIFIVTWLLTRRLR
jgi:deoxycytidine triphosphate deaminase